MTTTSQLYLDVAMADEARLAAAKLLLGYAAASRGLTMGQALLALVREAADEGSYPPEVRERLAEVRAASRARAAERALAALDMRRSA